MGHFKHHIFFCENQRDGGRECCQDHDAAHFRDHAKARIKAAGATGPGQVRVNKAGCLDRCEQGPVCVVYPDETWYSFVDEADIDEIVDSHLLGGTPVERLKI